MSPGISSEQCHRMDSQHHLSSMAGHSSLHILGVFWGCSSSGPVVGVGGCIVVDLGGLVYEGGGESKGVIVVVCEGGDFLSAAVD